MELAVRLFKESGFKKIHLAKSLNFNRNAFYTYHVKDAKDKQLANQIENLYETDDTLGHKKLAVLLHVNRKRVLRVMAKYEIASRKKRRKYRYPGKADNLCDNLLRTTDIKKYEIIFSDIFEFKLCDGSKIYCCFVIRKYTRQILAFCWGYSMPAGLVVEAINRIALLEIKKDPQVIFHSDQGKQYGARMTMDKLIEYGFTRSMSRAGTPTDNPIAERFVGLFKLAVVERHHYDTLGEFLLFAEKWLNFYNQDRPHEGLKMFSPNQFAKLNNLQIVSYLAVNSAY